MEESATLRERRRLETEHRITICAQRLTDERGLDGFTMDELAETAEVSRRTLFNYFPSKIDAVLGNPPEVPPDVLATFYAGGPHGHLVDDLGELAMVLLRSKVLDREEMARGRRIVVTTPRLIVAAHERFEALAGEFVEMILAREGQEYGADRARLLVQLFVALFDGCLPTQEGDDRPLGDVFLDQLRLARELLA
ncbi:TetR family transcriptional regulator [Nocardioides sp. 503]|uniref:TetR/AcrR family transcriptional regulator n=1 Tax=Nocardioides sp. 503 TaxID=2508326 RepID=UPI001ADBEA95|nr:TetR family transcriptional regulator [Nocardioides sp. 503]